MRPSRCRRSALVRAAAGTGALLLAPSTKHEVEQSGQAPCEQAMLREDVDPVGAATGTDVFGDQAQVRFAADTAFDR